MLNYSKPKKIVANKQYNAIYHPKLTGNIMPNDWYKKFTKLIIIQTIQKILKV